MRAERSVHPPHQLAAVTCEVVVLKLKDKTLNRGMAGSRGTAAPLTAKTSITSSLSKLQSLNGLFAIYKKQGPTSAEVLNTLKETLLKGKMRNKLLEVCCLLTTIS